MRLLCCFTTPDLTEPLPVAPQQARPQQATSSTYVVPDNVNTTSALLQDQESPYGADESHEPSPAPERSMRKSAMSSPDAAPSEDELRTTGKSNGQWKDEEKVKQQHSAHSHSVVNGEDWRKWKDNPASKDYTILNTLGRGAFADVRSKPAALWQHSRGPGAGSASCAHAPGKNRYLHRCACSTGASRGAASLPALQCSRARASPCAAAVLAHAFWHQRLHGTSTAGPPCAHGAEHTSGMPVRRPPLSS